MLTWAAYTFRRRGRRLYEYSQQIEEYNHDLKLSLRALEISQEENQRIMRIVAHDLRNPINGFIGISDILLQQMDSGTEEAKMVELIHETAEEALTFVNDLLCFNISKDDLTVEPLELDEIVGKVCSILRYKAGEKKIELVSHIEPVALEGNREKLGRAFANLVNNAIKFSHESGEIEVELRKVGSEAVFSVKDHGIGIPEHLKDQIFEMTKKKQRVGTGGESSTGLGLVICQQLVKAHGGRIWFESEEGKGTKFFIALPLT